MLRRRAGAGRIWLGLCATCLLLLTLVEGVSGAPGPCPNEERRVGPSAALPDCRAYEMVSPLDKNGGSAQALPPANSTAGVYTSYRQSSPNGKALTYTSGTAFSDAVSGVWANQYIAHWGENGWATDGISAPRGTAIFEGEVAIPIGNWDLENLFEAFTPDLCSAWVRDTNVVPLTPDGLAGYVNLYRRDNCSGGRYEALTSQGPYGPASEYLNDNGEDAAAAPGPGLRFQGASSDLRHQVFISGASLRPDSVPVGFETECVNTTQGPVASFSYQWLRNGVPIEGATSPSYTTVHADVGAAIQCQVFAINTNAGSTQVAIPPGGWIVAPPPAILPPVAPPSINAPEKSADLVVGGPGGQVLTCNPLAREWKGAPSFSYQWYRNGVAISGATSSTYVVSADDVATRAAFQCAVTGTNTGGSTMKVSANQLTTPRPGQPASNGPPAPNAGARVRLITQLYDLHDGELELVSILPNGEPSPLSAAAGRLESRINNRESSLEHAVSMDGSRIFWSTVSAGNARKIYVRIDGEKTLPISEEVSPADARFWTAAAGGSAVLFTIGGSLYEFDVDAAEAGASDPERLIAQQVPGILGASDDLSMIYFVSTESLMPGAVPGAWNLYLEDGGVTELVTVLSEEDREVGEHIGPIRPDPIRRTSRITADGKSIAFQALGSLTGYENVDPVSGKRYTEVFHYDAESDELTCVSCNPSGASPSGGPILIPYSAFELPLRSEKVFNERFGAAATLPPWEREQYASRLLSEDGNRVFFHSNEALDAGDTNGVQDVYQWEAEGTGTCGEAGGCIDLISTGTSPQRSEFVDASATGDDVFFSTASSIHPQDEGQVDIYDARVGGGFPSPPPPPPPGRIAIPDPVKVTPASAIFRGPGDPAPRRDCRILARRATRLARRAKQTESAALSKRAKRLKRRVANCRRANRRASR